MTAPKKRLGDQVQVLIDGTVVACLRKVTPPANARDEVDATCIGDPIEEYIDSPQRKAGEITLDLVWEPGSVNSELLDTTFNDPRPDFRVVEWKIHYRMFGTTSNLGVISAFRIATFEGYIKSLTPATIENKTLVTRTVVIRQTTPIVWSTGS